MNIVELNQNEVSAVNGAMFKGILNTAGWYGGMAVGAAHVGVRLMRGAVTNVQVMNVGNVANGAEIYAPGAAIAGGVHSTARLCVLEILACATVGGIAGSAIGYGIDSASGLN